MNLTCERTLRVLLFGILAGCASPVQGIKMRMQSPEIDEAFRKLVLAVRADDYDIERLNPGTYALETKWRTAKEGERGMTGSSRDSVQVKLSIALSPRGPMYDLFLTPSLRQAGADSVMVPPPPHPLVQKWNRILTTILDKESREE